MQKSVLSQQNGKCRVSAEKGITSPDSLSHRLGVQAQPQARERESFEADLTKGEKKEKPQKEDIKADFNLLDYYLGGAQKFNCIWTILLETKVGMFMDINADLFEKEKDSRKL